MSVGTDTLSDRTAPSTGHEATEQEGNTMSKSATFHDVSGDTIASASKSKRIGIYNGHFEDARDALNDIYTSGQSDLTVGIVRMEQVGQVLCHLRDGGQSATAQEGFRQGHQLALGGSNTSAPALAPGESDLIDKLRARFGGDLSKADQFMADKLQEITDLKAARDDLAKKLRAEEDAHKATKKTVNAPDPALVQENADLKQANSDLAAANTKLQTDLAAEKAKKAPVTDTAATALIGKLQGHASHKGFRGKDILIRIPDSALTRDEKDLLGLSLVAPTPAPATP